MKLKISYIENEIIFDSSYINVLEIENKNYFYRIISDLVLYQESSLSENISFVDNEYKELNYSNKLNIIIDYFNIDFNSKKNITSLSKKIGDVISDQEKDSLIVLYNKIIKLFKTAVNDLNIAIEVNEDFNIDNLLKLLKLEIKSKDSILDNILLLIDIITEFNLEQLLIFINLKQYLSKEELLELYKYSIYNNVQIILFDSQTYGTTLEYEKKLIIDENLEEFML